jgi:NAD(P)-dependent dehydrogenase (short-subunit alcohol dehydrogenase family)
VLINDAGIMPAGKVIDETDKVTRRILDINAYGVILGSKLAAKRMVPRRSGHIINIASLAGESPTPGLATYCASKYAVLGFTDSARIEYRDTGIHFSSVLPTFSNTELVAGTSGAKLLKNAEPEDIDRRIHHPQARFGARLCRRRRHRGAQGLRRSRQGHRVLIQANAAATNRRTAASSSAGSIGQ